MIRPDGVFKEPVEWLQNHPTPLEVIRSRVPGRDDVSPRKLALAVEQLGHPDRGPRRRDHDRVDQCDATSGGAGQAGRSGAPAGLQPDQLRPPSGEHGPRAGETTVALAQPTKSHEVFGYAPYWSLPDWQSFPVSDFSTIAYFSVNVNANGSIEQSGPGWKGYNSEDFVDLINAAHLAGDRVVLTANDFSETSLYTLTHQPNAGIVLGTELLELIQTKDLDGVNLDLEGTGSADQSGLDTLVAQVDYIFHAANPHYQLTMATYASSAGDPSGFYDIAGLSKWVDAFFVMAYDVAQGATGAADENGGGDDADYVAQYVPPSVPPRSSSASLSSATTNRPAVRPGRRRHGSRATCAVLPGRRIGTHLLGHATGPPGRRIKSSGQWHQVFFDNANTLETKVKLVASIRVCWASASGRWAWKATTTPSSTCSTAASGHCGRRPSGPPRRLARRDHQGDAERSSGGKTGTTTTTGNGTGRTQKDRRRGLFVEHQNTTTLTGTTTTTTTPGTTTTTTIEHDDHDDVHHHIHDNDDHHDATDHTTTTVPTTTPPIDDYHHHGHRQYGEYRQHRYHGELSVSQGPSSTPRTRAPRRRSRHPDLRCPDGHARRGRGGLRQQQRSIGGCVGRQVGHGGAVDLDQGVPQAVVGQLRHQDGDREDLHRRSERPATAQPPSRCGRHAPRLDAVLVDGTAYVRAGTQFLEEELSLSTQQATQYAGQWISFKKGDPGFSTLSQSLGASDAIYPLVPEEPNLRVVGAASFSGHRPSRCTGSPASSPAAGDDREADDVRLDHGALPPSGRDVGRGQQRQRQTVERLATVFGSYNAKVDAEGSDGCDAHHLADVLIIRPTSARGGSGGAAPGP